MSQATRIAEARTRVHDTTTRQQSQILPDRDLIGVIAEQAFARTWALAMNMDITPAGDGGVDFVSRKGNRVDIKATKRPNGRLMVLANSLTADIYVLAIVDTDREAAEFVGWCTAKNVRQLGELKEYHGKTFYCVSQTMLIPFRSLAEQG